MRSSTALRQARRRAGLTQRQLAEITGVKQPAIARIESGASKPRVDTLQKLLLACGETLEALPKTGEGIDRTVIEMMLSLTPRERIESNVAAAKAIERLVQARRVR